MTNALHQQRLEQLETTLRATGLDAYIVPMVDEFQGEYTPAYAARLPYVTGFTGSAGMGVFFAAPHDDRRHTLFVDGRYTLQAANEVDTTRIKVLNSGDTSFAAWLAGVATGGAALRIGVDPWLLTIQQREAWEQATAALPVEWVIARPNLVDEIWPDQPAAPSAAVALHPSEFTGRDYASKRSEMIDAMTRHAADALVLTQADAINWLLNLRGGDIPFNPLLLGYFVLLRDGRGMLYTYPRVWGAEVEAYLAAHQVTTAPITDIFTGHCPFIPPGAEVMMDRSATPYGWFMLAGALGWNVVAADDPSQLPKAIKNDTELDGIRAAHARDGLALTRFLHWFDQRAARGKLPDELEVVATLEQFRTQDTSYRGPSFATIAGAGPHGAIIHYRADETSNRKLEADELLLLDSGGQYPDGTTDVTRTLATGTPSAVVKEHFTRVLKGHIALASAQFPVGTSGVQLDILARQHLWAAGLDFDHGTGHGVGAYLCVHEGPQRISKRGSSVPLVPGMVISNEPGYYAEGEYGIRIESLVAVVPAPVPTKRPMLAFETLTLVPIDTRLVDTSLLTSEERNWLNHYHRRVYETHLPHLSPEEQNWLAQVTRAI